MSNYENSVFHILYILLLIIQHGGRKTNVTLMSFLRLFTETITPERKSLFFQNYMRNVVKI